MPENGHRQVSLLSYEKIEDFKKKGAPVVDGAFGENLTVQGIDLKTLPIGTRLQCNEVLLEVTQIGKQCHSGCEIFKVMGDCIMPREGIFARVLKGGVISEGDEINVVKRPFRAAILTSSDSGYAGEREDLSGPTIRKILENNGYEVVHTILLPDDRDMLAAEMARIADEGIAELLLTTGGTGFSPRDCMPEATMDISEPDGSGDPGGHPCLQHDHYAESYAEQGNSLYPKTDSDYQSSGQSESGERVTGIYSAFPAARTGNSDRGQLLIVPGNKITPAL